LIGGLSGLVTAFGVVLVYKIIKKRTGQQ